jgi:hypothetical protein
MEPDRLKNTLQSLAIVEYFDSRRLVARDPLSNSEFSYGQGDEESHQKDEHHPGHCQTDH